MWPSDFGLLASGALREREQATPKRGCTRDAGKTQGRKSTGEGEQASQHLLPNSFDEVPSLSVRAASAARPNEEPPRCPLEICPFWISHPSCGTTTCLVTTTRGHRRGTRKVLQEVRRIGLTIDARHGYVFESEELRDYFESQSWYHPNPRFSPGEFDEGVLSDIERTNIDLIVSME